ncbi:MULTISPECIES: TPM domain-containing protein [Clostridium]|uniref:TPM domain-containing protein n=1 Tax=Clostridium TaxID=1485 RepID=UPI000414FFB3|nr:TPM domain-containing protein [Clostridium cadaveris]MDU4952309.1 TPM domain-containing protein [Clostridium sp.]MDY4948187.1 TPM domain-containing protein [Clostridium cadaveris]NME65472.1 TPM domain-containing protein [Clostridium cadaveris]NWK10582.1 TPM domain-containing protein [Clostridium cadaveris]
MKKKIFLFSLLILVLLFSSSAGASPQLPSPTPYKYINDYSGIINHDYAEKIVSIGRELENKTGSQAVAVVIDSTEGIPIEDYSIKLFRSWGIGEKGKDNGLLILVAVKDRTWRVEVGRGLEGVVPDALSNRVMESLAKPNFADGNYDDGILNSYSTFSDYIAKDYGITLDKSLKIMLPKEDSSNSNIGKVAVFVFFVLILLDVFLNKGRVSSTILQLAFWSNIGNRRGPGGGNSGGFGGFGGGSSNGGGSSGNW